METQVPAVSVDAEIQGGAPCFAGTRVPVKSLFDALVRGRSLAEFVDHFPTVRIEQARAVLDYANQIVRSNAAASVPAAAA